MDNGKHAKIKIFTTCRKESSCDHEKKKRATISPQKRYVHLKGVTSYKEAIHEKRDASTKVKTGKRQNESLIKLAVDMKYRINSYGMNVAFICEMGLKSWNIFGTRSVVRHIHNSLTVTNASGEACYMTPKEVTSGENPDYVFASMPCFNMAKL